LTQHEQIRTWLAHTDTDTEHAARAPSIQKRRPSSIIAHQLLQAPFEMLGVSVTMFVAGLGVYEGSTHTRRVGLNTVGGEPVGSTGVLVLFVVGTVFGCVVLGFLTGYKEWEDHVDGQAGLGAGSTEIDTTDSPSG
jgi:hypothetical protein